MSQKSQIYLALLLGGGIFHPAFVFVAAIYGANEIQRSGWQLNIQSSVWYRTIPHVVWLIPLLLLLARQPFPPDDALRHVVAYQFDYNYTQVHYEHLFTHAFSWWIGYEYLAGQLASLTSPETALLYLQLFCFAFVLIPLWLNLGIKKDAAPHYRWMMALMFALVLQYLLLPRIIQARPEILFVGLILLAPIMRPIAWLILGLLMSPLYWLSIIYAPAAFLLKTNLRNQIIVASIYVIGAVSFWLYYSNGQWIEGFELVKQWVGNRVADSSMGTQETLSVYASLANPGTLGLIALGFYTLTLHRPALTQQMLFMLAVMGWFMLPNMIRYAPTILAVFVVLLSTIWRKEQYDTQVKPYGWLVGLTLLVTAVIIIRPLGVKPNDLPDFKLLTSEARVLTTFDTSAFSMRMANPQAIIAPIFEFGASSHDVQNAVISLHKGKMDCQAINKLEIDYVVENTLTSTKPECVKLIQTKGSWRLWQRS